VALPVAPVTIEEAADSAMLLVRVKIPVPRKQRAYWLARNHTVGASVETNPLRPLLPDQGASEIDWIC